MEMNGGSSTPYLTRTPCVPLFCTLFNRGGDRWVFRLPGAGGDHFHCTVEPSPGHIRCRAREVGGREGSSSCLGGGPSKGSLGPDPHLRVFDLFREEKGTQTQTFRSGYLRVGWGSST